MFITPMASFLCMTRAVRFESFLGLLPFSALYALGFLRKLPTTVLDLLIATAICLIDLLASFYAII